MECSQLQLLRMWNCESIDGRQSCAAVVAPNELTVECILRVCEYENRCQRELIFINPINLYELQESARWTVDARSLTNDGKWKQSMQSFQYLIVGRSSFNWRKSQMSPERSSECGGRTNAAKSGHTTHIAHANRWKSIILENCRLTYWWEEGNLQFFFHYFIIL